MADSRSLGVTILGCVFVFFGGLTIFVIFLQVLESIGRYGFESVAVDTPEALKGFFIYAIMPVIIYATGLGILLLKSWARSIVVYFIPLVTLLFLGTESNLILMLFVVCLLIMFFSRPKVKKQFD